MKFLHLYMTENWERRRYQGSREETIVAGIFLQEVKIISEFDICKMVWRKKSTYHKKLLIKETTFIYRKYMFVETICNLNW